MREYKFRGFRRKTQEWVYGCAVIRVDSDLDDIIDPIGDNSSITYAVEKGSIGQYTGLKDINGKEIYEGDIIENGIGLRGKIYYDEAETSYFIEPIDHEEYIVLGLECGVEVIGNIYKNLELMKDEI